MRPSSASATISPASCRKSPRRIRRASPAAKVAILAFTEAAYRTEWARVVGTAELPAVDFETESVVFLLAFVPVQWPFAAFLNFEIWRLN